MEMSAPIASMVTVLRTEMFSAAHVPTTELWKVSVEFFTITGHALTVTTSRNVADPPREAAPIVANSTALLKRICPDPEVSRVPKIVSFGDTSELVIGAMRNTLLSGTSIAAHSPPTSALNVTAAPPAMFGQVSNVTSD